VKRRVRAADFVPLSDFAGLTPSQLETLNWLRRCWFQSRNSILTNYEAPEIIAALSDLVDNQGLDGVFLIVSNSFDKWQEDFERFSNLNTVTYDASSSCEEYEIFQERKKGTVKFHVLIVSYETVVTSHGFLQEVEWRYVVLDDWRALKNHSGSCYHLLTELSFEQCTVLADESTVDDPESFWSILHLMHPKKFRDLAKFLAAGPTDDTAAFVFASNAEGPIPRELVIEVEPSKTQKMQYESALARHSRALRRNTAIPAALVTELRKVCGHSFLCGDPASDAVSESGKLIFVDKLLGSIKEGNRKNVLIIVQMAPLLDLLDEYCEVNHIRRERIDCLIRGNERQRVIERFARGQKSFVLL
jgi:SNF2 family DNA or RNA helicase